MLYFRQFPKVRGGSALWAGYPQATTLLLNETFESQSVVSVALDASEDADVAAFSVDVVGANPTVSLSAVEDADVAAFNVGLRQGIALGAVEDPDTASLAVSVFSSVAALSMGATEGPDVALFSVLNPFGEVQNSGGYRDNPYYGRVQTREEARAERERLGIIPKVQEQLAQVAKSIAPESQSEVDAEAIRQALIRQRIAEEAAYVAYVQYLILEIQLQREEEAMQVLAEERMVMAVMAELL